MFANDTLHPRAEALATSAVADSFVEDGAYGGDWELDPHGLDPDDEADDDDDL